MGEYVRQPNTRTNTFGHRYTHINVRAYVSAGHTCLYALAGCRRLCAVAARRPHRGRTSAADAVQLPRRGVSRDSLLAAQITRCGLLGEER